MRFVTTWLVALFLAVAYGETTFSDGNSTTKVEGTTEASLISSPTEKSMTDDIKAKTTQIEKSKVYDENDLITGKEMTPEELFVIEKVIEDQEKVLQEKDQKTTSSDNIENSRKADEINDNPENPIESKISKDIIDIRSQETNPKSNQENSSPDIQFDDSETDVASDPPPRYGQRSRNFRQKIQDSAPLLQLTQGGYERPYKRPRYRDRDSPRPDSSKQSENVQKPDSTSNNKRQDTMRITPQVTYANTAQPSYVFGQGPFMNPPFDASARDMLAINQVVPPSAQNGFLNSPPAEFTGYPTVGFQPQFTPNRDVGSIPNFNRDPSNSGVYQTLSSDPFQTPRILFQNNPQIQPQSVMMDSAGNVQSQFQQNPFSAYSGYDNIGGSSTPSYESLFRNSAVNAPFQMPSNFYGNAPNAPNPFNSLPINFLSQYPNFGNVVPSQFLQYPAVTTGAQNNLQSSNNPRFDSETSQDQNRAKVVVQNAHNSVNREDSAPARFRTGLQANNIANVYMRYPTIEAGYAIEEIMPMLNQSDESKEESKRSNEEQTNNPNADPNRNVLNSVRSNQKINNSFDFSPEFFRNAPIDFRYQSPQGGIFTQQIDRNRGLPNYPSRNFEPRIPFNAIASLPESFLGVDHQQHVHPETNETPSCAKGNNASVCFEDNDYPKNDILYTLNSNSFLTDRLVSPEAPFAFVERNSNETEQNKENYACDVATKYGTPLRAKNIAGLWKIIVNLQGRFSQPVRMEVCKTLGSSCSYTNPQIKTTCVQKFSLQRMLTWSPSRGIYLDIYKIPVACSCQIIDKVEV